MGARQTHTAGQPVRVTGRTAGEWDANPDIVKSEAFTKSENICVGDGPQRDGTQSKSYTTSARLTVIRDQEELWGVSGAVSHEVTSRQSWVARVAIELLVDMPIWPRRPRIPE